MKNLLLGFILGLLVATAGFVSAQGFMDLESGTMYQQVPGGLLNMNTGELRLTAPTGPPQEIRLKQPC
jgi:hypothetical protein